MPFLGIVKPYKPRQNPTTVASQAKNKKQRYKTKTKHRDKHGNKHEGNHEVSNVHTTDYEEKSLGKDKKPSESTSSGKASSKAKAKTTVPDVDEKAIPDPHPEGTPVTTVTYSTHSATISIHSGVLPVLPSSTHSPTLTSGFSPLPPLAAFATSLQLTSSVVSASSSTAFSTATNLSGHQAQAHSATKHLPTAIVVLLAVCAAFSLVGAFLVSRVCCRPRKHIPTPSLPILQDPFQDEKQVDPEEESLFGGHERSSARPGSNTFLLPWTQYPHTSVIKPAPTLDVNAQRPGSPPKRTSLNMTQKGGYPFTAPGSTGLNASRTPNRISAMSMSVYPGSPMSLSGGNGVGVAIGGSPLTADGLPVLHRSNSKASTRSMSKTGKSARHSMVVSDRLVPGGLDDSDLYAGSEIATPALTHNMTTSNTVTGRARVKAAYAPATLLRASTTLSGMPHASTPSLIDEPNPFEQSHYILPPISPMMKTDDRRERDTKALTSALGLASPNPVPPSPQTTVYPDDSITLAGDRRRSRVFSHGRAPSHAMSPTTEASARLGKLMLGEFQSMTSVASKAAPASGNPSSRTKPVTRKRVEELPPRVPSPPPLPSLAQMALAHANQEDYDTYRSPTYSIYGLYEADRKSKAAGES